MNIRFIYLYRDAGNFKNWGEVTFENPRAAEPQRITETADSFLFAQYFFNASKAGVPDLHFADHDYELDHEWHELYSFEATDDPPNDPQGRDIDRFLESLKIASEVCIPGIDG